jgi:hypothetical protein
MKLEKWGDAVLMDIFYAILWGLGARSSENGHAPLDIL